MKKTVKFMLGCLLFGSGSILAFPTSIDPTKPPKKCETFDLKEETSYFIDSDRQLSLAEEVKYRPTKVLKHVERCADSEITTVLNPKEVWQSWMPQLVKTVIDANGITYLDGEGKILYQYPKEALASDEVDQLQWEDEVAFELNDKINNKH